MANETRARLISFDIDRTLEIGEPPGVIPMSLVRAAKAQGWLIGSCSDRTASAQELMWQQHNIEADFWVVKNQLALVRERFEAACYVHIGDTEVDRFYATRAGFDFLHVSELTSAPWLGFETLSHRP